MRLGTLILQLEPWHVARGHYVQAEQLGFDIAYAADHMTHATMKGAWLADGWTTLAAAAEATSRIQLGTMVASAAVRNPVALLRASGTVQDISGGRFLLGLGAGTADDAAADRGVRPTTGELMSRYTEVVEAYAALRDGATQWRGKFVAAEGVFTAARPPGSEPPPLLLVGHGPRGYRLAARHAAAWNTYGGAKHASLPKDDLDRDRGRKTRYSVQLNRTVSAADIVGPPSIICTLSPTAPAVAGQGRLDATSST